MVKFKTLYYTVTQLVNGPSFIYVLDVHAEWSDWQQPVNSSTLDKMVVISQTTLLKCIFMNEKFCTSIRISLELLPKGQNNNNKSSLVQVMAWRRKGDKPFPESVLIKPTDVYMRLFIQLIDWTRYVQYCSLCTVFTPMRRTDCRLIYSVKTFYPHESLYIASIAVKYAIC